MSSLSSSPSKFPAPPADTKTLSLLSNTTKDFLPNDSRRAAEYLASTGADINYDTETSAEFIARMTASNVRHRTTQACDKCRDRKTKCSGERPNCQRCANRGLVCHYTDREARALRAHGGFRLRQYNYGLLRNSVSSVDLRHANDFASQAVRFADPSAYPLKEKGPSSQSVVPDSQGQQWAYQPGEQFVRRFIPSAMSLLPTTPSNSHHHEDGSCSQPTSANNSPIFRSFPACEYPRPFAERHSQHRQPPSLRSSQTDITPSQHQHLQHQLSPSEQGPLHYSQPFYNGPVLSPLCLDSYGQVNSFDHIQTSFVLPDAASQFNRESGDMVDVMANDTYSTYLSPVNQCHPDITRGAEHDDDGAISSASGSAVSDSYTLSPGGSEYDIYETSPVGVYSARYAE